MKYYDGDLRCSDEGSLGVYANGKWHHLNWKILEGFVPCEDVENEHYKSLVKETNEWVEKNWDSINRVGMKYEVDMVYKD